MIKSALTIALLLFVIDSQAKDNAFLEVGVGIEYGGLGTQIHLPIQPKYFDVYLSMGIFGVSSSTNEEYGVGAGIMHYLDKNHHVLNFYYGALNVDTFLTDDFEVKSDIDYGISIGYKYYFNKRSKSGFSIGASYNIYEDDNYPFLSLGYRY